MDLSKLPRLSQTPPPPEGHNPDAPPEPPVHPSEARGFPVTPVGSPQTPAGAAPLYCRCGAQLAPGTKFCSNCGANLAESLDYRPAGRGASMAMGPEAWISIALGVILLLATPAAPRLWHWHTNQAGFGNKYSFSDAAGNPLAYTQTVFYVLDWGMAAFAVVLILEGIVLILARSRVVVMIGLGLTLAVVALNIYGVAKAYPVIGFQIFNAVAVAFGIYMAFFQFALLRGLR
jgi:hypothetical protein